MNLHLGYILKKMCEMVGANYDEIDFKKQSWFTLYKWNANKESEFKEWFVNYLMENKDARFELMEFPTTRINIIKKLIDEFIFNYGWTTDD